MQARTEQGDQSEVRKSSIHEQGEMVLPGQPVLQLPGMDPVQFSAQHNLTSISGSSSFLSLCPQYKGQHCL